MKKIRPIILAMFMFLMVLSVTACGSKNSNTQTTTGASQSSTSAASSTTPSTSSMNTTSEGATKEGIINGVVEDVEKGMDAAGNSMESGARESTTAADTTHSATETSR